MLPAASPTESYKFCSSAAETDALQKNLLNRHAAGGLTDEIL